ncbi:MAG: hypothetical protein IPM18_03715 [Phycisphaerales bacterium]|nr:hypothetical protein [Phycisphaerales bacterium]
MLINLADRAPVVLALVTLGACVVIAVAQDATADIDAAPVIVEHPSELVPPLPPEDRSQRPQPISLHVRDAFVPYENLVLLEPPTVDDFALADALHAQRYIDVRPGPARIGVVRLADPPAIAEMSREAELEDGRRLWTLAIASPGAEAIRVHLRDFDVQDSELWVYGLWLGSPAVRGPFTGLGPLRNGEFWTPTVPGDTLYLEVAGYVPPRFDVIEVVHFDRSPYGLLESADPGGGPRGDRELPCHLDVMCESVASVARRATGLLTFISGGEAGACSGTQLNDQDPDTLVPYLLTAAHCVNTQSAVNTLEVLWLWERHGCGGPLPDPADLDSSFGGTLVVTQASNDMSFIRLNGEVKSGTALAGWTTSTSIENAFGVHHPRATWKRAVFLDPVGFCPGCLCWSGSTHDYYNMVSGLTEPGSSGSGVFTPSGLLSGQLHGVCSVCCDPEDLACDNIDDYWSVYGEFEETYPVIRRWLEIGGTIHVSAANTTAPWTGTPSDPFLMVAQAHSLAWNGARIKIQAGIYHETITLNKQVTVLGSGGLVQIGP